MTIIYNQDGSEYSLYSVRDIVQLNKDMNEYRVIYWDGSTEIIYDKIVSVT